MNLYRLISWDDTENPEYDGEKPIAVWEISPEFMELDKFGYWKQYDRNGAPIKPIWEGTVDEFISEYRIFPNHFAAPGGTFTIQAEITWVIHSADKRLK